MSDTWMNRQLAWLVVAVVMLLMVAMWFSFGGNPIGSPSANGVASTAKPLTADEPRSPHSLAKGDPGAHPTEGLRVAAPSSALVTGTVRIASRNGPIGAELFGTLHCSFDIEGGAPEFVSTSIRTSFWQLRASAGADLRFTRAIIEGRRFAIEPASVVAVDGMHVDLLLHPAPAIRLHVVDADDGQPMSVVELVRAQGDAAEPSSAPSPLAQWVGRDLASPVELPHGSGTDVYWVRSPGYAWAQVAVSYADAADRCVALQRVSEVAVLLNGMPVGASGALVVRYDDGSELATQRARAPEVALRSEVVAAAESPLIHLELPPGRWAMDLVDASGAALTSGAVTLQTYAATPHTVVLDFRPRRPTTTTRVVLHAIVEAGGPPLTDVRLIPDESLSSASGRSPRTIVGAVVAREGDAPVLADIEFVDVEPGAYRLVLLPQQWSGSVVVSTDSAAPDVHHVPAVTTRRFGFRDGSSGEFLQVAALMWTARGAGAFEPTKVGPGGVVRIETASQELDFLVYSTGSTTPVEVAATAADGDATAVVEVPPTSTLVVSLRERDGVVPMRASWWDRVTITGAQGSAAVSAIFVTSSGASAFGHTAEYRVLGAGTFRVRLPKLNSSAEALEREVELRPGKASLLVFEVAQAACK